MSSSPSLKTKLCWHCEGSIAPDSRICPYCATDLVKEVEEPFLGAKEFPSRVIDLSKREKIEGTWGEKIPTIDMERYRLFIVIASTLLGSFFIVVGLLFYFFSGKDGYVTLRWNGSYAPYYILLGFFLSYYAATHQEGLD